MKQDDIKPQKINKGVTGGVIAAFALLGAFLSRWHGGGFFKSPRSLKNILWSLPFGLFPAAAFLLVGLPWWSALIVFLIGFGFGMLKSTGQGRGFRLDEPMEAGSKPEAVEKYLIGWLMPHMPLYWYKVLIMATVGVLTALGAAFALGYLFVWSGLIVALGGLLKGVNAMIFDKKTEHRELIDGFTVYLGLAIATLMALVHHEIVTF